MSKEIGPQAKSDNAVTAKYRLIQSEYRTNILNEDYGIGPNKTSKNKYGNMLVDGESTRSNFISDNAYFFAKQKVLDKQINKDMTIEEFRLFNNMLSSMPMCFNLFSDLRTLLLTNQNAVSSIVKLLFPELEWLEKVTYIDVEFIPTPIADYINDKSAFDAMILAEDKDGKKGLISIETKYTDLLGSNTSSNSITKNELISSNKIFSKNLVEELKENGYKQIHRNYLLTYSFAKRNKFKHFSNVVISPSDDVLSVEEINELHDNLLLDKKTIFKIELETFVNRGIESNIQPISDVFKKFKKRYTPNT